jgi:flagellar assembly protein FliH
MSGLTAWERWELASFDAEQPAKPVVSEPVAQPEAQPLVAEELDRLRRQAQEEGHQSGYAAGLQAGREAGQAAVGEEAARLREAAQSLEQSFAELDQQVADELLALAVEIARQVVRGELTARPSVILDVVQEALDQLPHQHATISLHPSDAALVRAHQGDNLGHAGHRIREDNSLKPGDCLVEAGGSVLDASVATRWRRVLENLGLDSAWQEPEKQ